MDKLLIMHNNLIILRLLEKVQTHIIIPHDHEEALDIVTTS